jgi:hypothetical protein
MQHLIRTYQRERKYVFETRSKLLEKLKAALQGDLVSNRTVAQSTARPSVTRSTATSTAATTEGDPSTVAVVVKKLEQLEDDPAGLQIEDQLAHILPGLEKALNQPEELEKQQAAPVELPGGLLTPGDLDALTGLPDATERSL